MLIAAAAARAATSVVIGVGGGRARRRGRLAGAPHGTASAFGARFDMETDAPADPGAVHPGLAVTARRAPWVLPSGLLRYVVRRGRMALALDAGPLAPSRRRQSVCVVQIVALLSRCCRRSARRRPAPSPQRRSRRSLGPSWWICCGCGDCAPRGRSSLPQRVADVPERLADAGRSLAGRAVDRAGRRDS